MTHTTEYRTLNKPPALSNRCLISSLPDPLFSLTCIQRPTASHHLMSIQCTVPFKVFSFHYRVICSPYEILTLNCINVNSLTLNLEGIGKRNPESVGYISSCYHVCISDFIPEVFLQFTAFFGSCQLSASPLFCRESVDYMFLSSKQTSSREFGLPFWIHA